MPGELELKLSEEERELILKRRQDVERVRWMQEGIHRAADYLINLGDQCCGGRGQEKDENGKLTGEPYYSIANMVREFASKVST